MIANQYKTPIRGEIRLNDKSQCSALSWTLTQQHVDGTCFLMFEYKNVRFRLYYDSKYSHVRFYAYASFGWSISDSIYDFANKEYIEDLGKYLSNLFECPVALEWYNRSNKGRMRFYAGQVWSSPEKMPRVKLPKEDDGYVYKIGHFTSNSDFIPEIFEEKESKSSEQETVKIAC